MSIAYEKGKAITKGIGYMRFLPATNNYTALVTLPYMCFEEYAPDGQRMYERGEVVRVGREKYLLQGDGRIDVDKPPPVNPLCKLFRDSGRYPWVREEYCLQGFEREYNGEWYKVIADRVDDATIPPNSQAWEKIEE